MKKLNLTTIAILMFTLSFGQITSEVISVDSTLKKEVLYSNALTFFAYEFKSANNVIQMKDVESGKVIGKGIADNREITITISCKDGKYKYEIEITPIPSLIFEITKFGTWNGKTVGTMVNGQYDVMFIWGNGWGWPNVHLNGEGTPMGGKKLYTEWKTSVEAEIEKNKVRKIDDLVLLEIVKDLKKEMSKVDF